ncbi:hypothetical protein L6164_032542 [Bauhinia variegata]|uniref:Uncharacterized protein n=1 Tax=Bauhinia variegata TaxID=167791 RepID=A0ACB9KP48_BAUVA|nr:hypothetical protein L6164_032542 [Bauhinia variegata]
MYRMDCVKVETLCDLIFKAKPAIVNVNIGTKSYFQETNWQRECLRSQICRLPNALWCADRKKGAHQCPLNHRQPQWACPHISLVYPKPEGIQTFSERSSEVLEQCILERPSCLRGHTMRSLCTSGNCHVKGSLRVLL